MRYQKKKKLFWPYDCVKVTLAIFTILCGGELCYALFPYVMLCYFALCCTLLCYVVKFLARLCYVVLCCAKLCYVVLWGAKVCYTDNIIIKTVFKLQLVLVNIKFFKVLMIDNRVEDNMRNH